METAVSFLPIVESTQRATLFHRGKSVALCPAKYWRRQWSGKEEGLLEATNAGNVEQAWALLARARPHLLNIPCFYGFQRAFLLLPACLLRYLAKQRVVALLRWRVPIHT
eukprot:1176553-Prorocentrum_minimum.AAC.2